MLEDTIDYLEQHHRGKYEVLIVDDGSTDGTAKVALDWGKKMVGKGGDTIKVVKLERNRGKGGAVTHVRIDFT